jgi:hypothetical protein
MKHHPVRQVSLLALAILLIIGSSPTNATSVGPIFSPPSQFAASTPIHMANDANETTIEWLTSIGGNAYAIGTDGTIAYVVDTSGLTILDIHNPTQPVRLGLLTLHTLWDGEPHVDMFRVGSVLYIAGGAAGLWIVDISDLFHPRLLARYATFASGIWVVNNRAYVAGDPFSILDVSNPAAPVLLGSYPSQSSRYKSLAILPISPVLTVGVESLMCAIPLIRRGSSSGSV